MFIDSDHYQQALTPNKLEKNQINEFSFVHFIRKTISY